MGVLRELLFHELLDASGQFLSRDVGEPPRRIPPSLHEIDNILLNDNIRVMPRKLAGHGANEQRIKANGAEENACCLRVCLLQDSVDENR